MRLFRIILASALIAIIPAAVGLAAPSNSITVTERSGAAQSSRPFTISRVFARGEIANYPQARVNGSPVTTQADVKTRWPDGSVQHAMISFLASLPAGGATTVDFVNQSSGNNAGEMNRAAILAANWGAQIEVTNSTTLVASARQMVTDWTGNSGDNRVTYWLRGPICTQILVEDRSSALAYDLGWNTYKPLHPIFVVTLYPGYTNGARVEMILENMWTTKLQDQSYALALKTGSPANQTVYSKGSFTHFARTRWRKDFWSGTAPGAVAINYNLAYIAHSKAVPNFDLSKVVPQSAVDGDTAAFNATDKGDINGSALWQKNMTMTGGRDDLGLFPAWYVRYLYTFSPQLTPVVQGLAAVAAYVPIHVRESATALKFDEARAVDAFGRSFSVDAHPTDFPASVGTLASTGWAADIAHVGSFSYVPYLITGDWYYLEEMYQYAAWVVRASDPANVYWGRNGSWGIVSFALQTRGVAWGLRELAHAAFAAPDGSPEKAYFQQKLNNNIAMREGEQNITDGAFYDPSNGSKWYWGRNTVAGGTSNPLGFIDVGDAYGSKDGLTAAVEWPDSPWQYGYAYIVFGHIEELGAPIVKLRQKYAKNLLHQLQDPAYNPYLTAAYRMPVRQASTHTYFQSWASVFQGFTAAMQASSAWPCGDEANFNHGYPHIMKAAASFLPGIDDGALLGQNAWNWMSAHVGYQDMAGYNPQWSLLPRSQSSTPPPPVISQCDLNSDGRTDSADVQLSINRALGIDACSTGDLDNNSKCDAVDVQRVVNAAIGSACRVGL